MQVLNIKEYFEIQINLFMRYVSVFGLCLLQHPLLLLYLDFDIAAVGFFLGNHDLVRDFCFQLADMGNYTD